ncbi:SPOR domain-containing protein [Catenovulum sediminis]|uniref:SPOR domain-containing protein n=1 Tax=Catenovulum sediminis TaxID=1740262 RepID=A0ABV1REN0_9ALTE|nr:SPOR domain-containing protein [Catenovulum sediminis]
MARDYVKKGKPTPRTKRKPEPEVAVANHSKLKFMIVLALCLVIGFAYFLWSIKDRAPEPKPKVVEKVKPKALPKVPEEKWEYVKELENKTIEVDVPDRKDQPQKQYQMQCGSFRKLDQANSLKAQIAFTGLESFVKRTEGSNGVWFRVVLGPYDTKRAAESDRHRLQNAKINGCQIWYWT